MPKTFINDFVFSVVGDVVKLSNGDLPKKAENKDKNEKFDTHSHGVSSTIWKEGIFLEDAPLPKMLGKACLSQVG